MTSKTTMWVIAIVLVFLLLQPKVAAAATYARRPAFGGPLPGPNYGSSPPTHPSNSVTDLLNTAILTGGGVLNHYVSNLNPGAVAPAPIDIAATTPVIPDEVNFSELD